METLENVKVSLEELISNELCKVAFFLFADDNIFNDETFEGYTKQELQNLVLRKTGVPFTINNWVLLQMPCRFRLCMGCRLPKPEARTVLCCKKCRRISA
jgi:hypothetical protein